MSAKQSTWRPAELTREIAAALPTDISIDAASVGELLKRLTRDAIEAHCVDISRPVPAGAVLRRDGRPVRESIADRALTTPAILAQEERLSAWAERRMAGDGIDSAAAAGRSRVALTVPQAETAAAVAGDADVVLVVGPAGTGKTTALAPAVEQLRAEGRVVFGVAPSAAAAEVLGAETGSAADTIDKLLFEHSGDRQPGHRFDLPGGATVIVDEAAMVSTANLDRLAGLADDRGWRVALVGDPMQFSAVGRGGMFAHLIDTHGAIELDQVHRFTNDWERAASLRLRSSDASIAEVYEMQGRIHGGTGARMERDALDAWETARGRNESVVLAAPTNETVARLNHAAQQRRLAAGQLDTTGRTTVAGGYRVHVGDEVATRRNHRRLRTDQGHMIANRDQWVIDVVHRNGDLTVHGRTGAVRLPGDYVQAHVELAYAQTSHATQGRTVDRSVLVLDGPCDVRGLYVPMTRGRERNDVYIATTGDQTAVEIFAESVTRSWIDTPAHARQTQLADNDRHRPGTLPAGELRALFSEQASLADTLDRLRRDLEELPNTLASANELLENTRGHFEAARDRLQKAFDTIETHDRPLRRRRHEPEIAAAKATIRDLPGAVAGYAADVKKIEAGITATEQRLAATRQHDQRRPTLQGRLDDITRRLDDDRHIRTRQLRRNTPDRITDTLGARPTRGENARAWDNAAGQVDQHQTAYGLSSGLGPARRMGLPAGYLHSRTQTETAERNYLQAIARERQRTLQRNCSAAA